jgi:hypothetical protein
MIAKKKALGGPLLTAREQLRTKGHLPSLAVGSVLALGAVLVPGCGSQANDEQDIGEVAGDLSTTTYQAENASVSGGIIRNAEAGYTGTGYVDYQHASGDFVDWTVSIPTTGYYNMTFRYANGGSTNRPLSLAIDGSTVNSSMAFNSTGSWTTWKTSTQKVKVISGTHHVRLTAIGSSGGNIDYLQTSGPTAVIKHVFVIAMENHDGSQIYGNTSDAPYINDTLIASCARATNFNDELALSVPSEPHYIWMEAGTNAFSDRTFTDDSDPSSTNSTSSTAHLIHQIKSATNGVTWRTYQEGQNSTTGSCPIVSSGFYHAKHDPFVFFQEVSGNPPSKTNTYCSSHSRPYNVLATDLSNNDVAGYTFITPNACHDMHGQSGCPDGNAIRAGDNWLKSELPRIISWVNAHAGVIYITWDEGSSTSKLPFLAIGPGVKSDYAGSVSYTHGSMLKSVEESLQLSILSKVSTANDLSDLFKAGQFP